ncbi:MAG: galactofuranosyltransferase [Muribaculaceae bacterium]|nr:galactofuranosyltransferase [Muribaculaceae bacterium]
MHPRRLTYLTRNYKGTAYGGAKARIDMEDILQQTGAVNLGLKRSFHKNKIKDFLLNLCGIASFMIHIWRSDVLVLQYPVKKYFTFLCRWAHFRGARVITLVHDLGSFRRRKLTPQQEISRLEHSDVLIVANASTVQWLQSHGIKRPMAEQVAWDYLSSARAPHSRKLSPECVFVGHLGADNNAFLYKLPPELKLTLYGAGQPSELPQQLCCKGLTAPDDIISAGAGSFGLIWYGNSLDYTPDGFIGEYIKYCNSHKLGLYMRMGVPVIIWSGAGAAPFVKENGIGLTVDSLHQLPRLLASVTPEEYSRMQQAVSITGDRMARGHYFLSALQNALRKLEN